MEYKQLNPGYRILTAYDYFNRSYDLKSKVSKSKYAYTSIKSYFYLLRVLLTGSISVNMWHENKLLKEEVCRIHEDKSFPVISTCTEECLLEKFITSHHPEVQKMIREGKTEVYKRNSYSDVN